MEPLFLFSLQFFVCLLLFALLYTLWRSYICCNGRLIKFIKGLLRSLGESIVILLYIKREFCLCFLSNKAAVEGTNDRLKSIVLGWRESLGFFSFSFFFPIVIYCQIFLRIFLPTTTDTE
ncbi:hypothetical protein ACB092_02G033200 [Castanea dentata]